MVKYSPVLVCFDLREKNQSWLLRVWTKAHAVTNKFPGIVFLLRVKDSGKQAVLFCVCVNLHELDVKGSLNCISNHSIIITSFQLAIN